MNRNVTVPVGSTRDMTQPYASRSRCSWTTQPSALATRAETGDDAGMFSTYAWRRLDLVGTNLVVVETSPAEVVVHSREVCADGDVGWSMSATIHLDDRWGHRSAVVEVVDAGGVHTLRLDALDALDAVGADVLDLAGNPFTNAFVLRGPGRGLEVGEAVEVVAAYVEAPGLTVRPVRQRYRRLAPDRWEYGDETGSFAMRVDDDGVVIEYEALAVRVPIA